MNEIPITITGNLTADPDLSYTQNGHAVVGLTIAQTPRFYDKQANEWKDGVATFVRASVWREFAENVAGSLHKGDRVVAQGVLQQRNFQDREGNPRSTLEMKIEAIGPDLRRATATVTRISKPNDTDSWQAPAGEDTPF